MNNNNGMFFSGNFGDDTVQYDLPDQGLSEAELMPDLEINPRTGFSRNIELQELRNQHPFLPIDPPYTESYNVLLTSSINEANIKIPPQALMYRVTFAVNAANAICLMGFTTSIVNAISTTAGQWNPDIIANPAPVWRACRGVQQLCFYNPGATGQARISVEFFSQL